jgi:hypothetical protein
LCFPNSRTLGPCILCRLRLDTRSCCLWCSKGLAICMCGSLKIIPTPEIKFGSFASISSLSSGTGSRTSQGIVCFSGAVVAELDFPSDFNFLICTNRSGTSSCGCEQISRFSLRRTSTLAYRKGVPWKCNR